MYVIVCYDIICDRRRAKLFRRMKDFLPRVQKSVFEGELPESRFPPLARMIREQMSQNEDTVRIYQVCKRCVPAVQVLGVGPLVEDEWEDLVI